MKDTMIYHFEYEQLFNVAELEIACRDSCDTPEENASGVCSRFVRAAEVLPQDGYFGLQFTPNAEGEPGASVFIDAALQVTGEDMNWILYDYASIGSFRQETLRSGDGACRIYALRHTAKSHAKRKDDRKKKWYTCSNDYFVLSREYSGIIKALAEAGGTLRFLVGGKRDGKGVILISLPDEMSLRLRAVLAQVFPHTEAVEMTDQADFERMPLRCVSEKMYKFLYPCYWKESAKKLCLCRAEASEISEDEDTTQAILGGDMSEDDEYDTPSTPIEELHLSVRAQRALKIAGINTVERLHGMTLEDLMKVRNLGRKCSEEILQKLRECENPSEAETTDEQETTAEQETAAEPAPSPSPSGAEMLAELIGLQNVKEQIRKIEAFARMKREMEERGMDVPVVLNMEFVGNPGTAKTTVARIVGVILHEIGLLKSGEMVEVGRADLVARYVGQTADQVKSVFKRAKGKLLFIDEAYSLLESCEGLYGDEAINTIVQEMENNRRDTVVIFAGYPKEMKAFFERNPGLHSRVPFRVCFSDYSAEEMLEIAALEASKRGFSIEPEAREKILAICAAAAQKPGAGNGRFCRNLVENAILNYAGRVYGGENAGEAQAFVLTGEDFEAPEEPAKETKQVRQAIGFCA